MKRYLQAGAVFEIQNPGDNYENWIKTGKNTGNLYIGYSVKKQFNIDKNEFMFKPLSDDRIDYIKNNYDAIILASANFINPYADFSDLALNLKKLNMLVVTLGIGAQASDTKSPKMVLKEGQMNFLKVISDSCNTLGIRGEFTAEVLDYLGIRNYTIIGCPSYYVNRTPKFKIVDTCYKEFSDLKIAYNFTHLSKKHDQLLVNRALHGNADLIGQMEYIENYWSTGFKYEPEYFEDISEQLIKEMSEKEKVYKSFLQYEFEVYKKYLKNHFNMFYDVNKWEAKIKNYDYIIGSRFHGCMIGIQNFIPALLVTHDSRTSELASFCNIPSITDRELLEIKSFERILQKGLIDYSKFNREYEMKFYNYIEFLRKNGIEDVDELFNL